MLYTIRIQGKISFYISIMEGQLQWFPWKEFTGNWGRRFAAAALRSIMKLIFCRRIAGMPLIPISAQAAGRFTTSSLTSSAAAGENFSSDKNRPFGRFFYARFIPRSRRAAAPSWW
jgi:hypothetical protein